MDALEAPSGCEGLASTATASARVVPVVRIGQSKAGGSQAWFAPTANLDSVARDASTKLLVHSSPSLQCLHLPACSDIL
jgi:hypothetical protein